MKQQINIAGRKLEINKEGNWYILKLDGSEYSRSMEYETTRNSVKNLAAGIAASAADEMILQD